MATFGLRPRRFALCLGLTISLLLASAEPARAQWPQKRGEFYFKIWDRLLIGQNVHLAEGGTAKLDRTFHDHSIQYYFELGVFERLTAVIRGNPIGWAKFGGESTFYSGMLQLGARYALIVDPLPVSIEASYGYAPPLGDGPLGTGTIEGESYVYNPTIERHRGALELSSGVLLSDWGWLNGGAGLFFSSADAIDPTLTARAGIGARSSFGLTGELIFSLNHPLGEVTFVDVSGVGQTRYVGFTLGASYWFTNFFAVNASVGGAFFVQGNAAVPSFTAGLELR